MKVCFNNGNCLQGEVCIGNSCVLGCATNIDCHQNEVCLSNKCMCAKGYSNSPSGCIDVDECDDDPCPDSADCTNVPGSYICSCPLGTVRDSDGVACIQPNECDDDDDCPGEQACKINGDGIAKCIDVCASSVCGKNAKCQVEDRRPVCECISGFFGDPNNLAIGCVQGECIDDNDCTPNRKCDRLNFKCIGKYHGISIYFTE